MQSVGHIENCFRSHFSKKKIVNRLCSYGIIQYGARKDASNEKQDKYYLSAKTLYSTRQPFHLASERQ